MTQEKVWKNAGILDVFPIFHTARLGQKIRRSPLSPPSGVALVYPESMKSRGIPDVFPDFHTAPGKQKISFSAADDLFRGSLGFLPVYHKRRLFAIYSPSLRIPNSPSLRASSQTGVEIPTPLKRTGSEWPMLRNAACCTAPSQVRRAKARTASARVPETMPSIKEAKAYASASIYAIGSL